MFARRQLEHGESLSQRTLRERQTTQLRGLVAAVCGAIASLALFSGPGTDESAAGVTCDMLQLNEGEVPPRETWGSSHTGTVLVQFWYNQ